MLESKKNSPLNNYWMKPTYMKNGLALYPITLDEYEEFRQLAMEFIVLDIHSKNNLNRQNFIDKRKKGLIPKTEKYKKLKFQNLFDFLVAIINEEERIKFIKTNKKEIEKIKEAYKDDTKTMNFINMAEQIPYSNILQKFIKLLNMITRIPTKFTGEGFIFYLDDNEMILNSDNFYEFRDIVMSQNVLYEPRIAPDPESQKEIDRELKNKFGDEESDLEAMVAFVTANCGIDTSNYTYYRLKADYEAKMREISYLGVSIFRANGCRTEGDKDIPYPNILEHLSLKDNPYSKDKIYKDSQLTEFDKQLMSKK